MASTSADMKPFLLAQPGPLGKDELRGDSDLFEAHNLTRIARAVLSGNMRHGDYLKGIAGGSDLRKVPGMGLADLALGGLMDGDWDFLPLDELQLQQVAALLPVGCRLTEVCEGLRVDLMEFPSAMERRGACSLDDRAEKGPSVANRLGRINSSGTEATGDSNDSRRLKRAREAASTAES